MFIQDEISLYDLPAGHVRVNIVIHCDEGRGGLWPKRLLGYPRLSPSVLASFNLFAQVSKGNAHE